MTTTSATTTTTATTATFSIPAAHLRRLLEVVLPYASTTTKNPVINAIRLELHNGRLTLAATDHYTLGVAASETTHTGGDADITLPLAPSKHLRRILPRTPHGEVVGTITVPTDAHAPPPRLSVSLPVAGSPEWTIAGHVEPDWARWRSLLEQTLSRPPEPATVLALTPQHLARVKTLGPLAIWRITSPSLPIIAMHHDGWHLVMLMPVRTEDLKVCLEDQVHDLLNPSSAHESLTPPR